MTDRQGRLVRDLTKNDFEVYEDGVLQKPSVFQFVDLPIEQPAVFDLVINMKTAKALGLKIPQSILLQATKVIQ